MTPPDEGVRRLMREHAVTAVVQIAVPTIVFCLLRAIGLGQWWSLMVGALAVAPHLVIRAVRRRRLDLTAIITVSVLALTLVLTASSTDPRTLAVHQGWTAAVGGLIGAWMLVTVGVGRPAQLTLGRTVAEVKRGPAGAAAWARRWDHDRLFRRGMRIDTAVWGTVLLVGAVVHIVGAYVLPIDLIVLVTNVAWFTALAGLIAWHVHYVRTHGLDA